MGTIVVRNAYTRGQPVTGEDGKLHNPNFDSHSTIQEHFNFVWKCGMAGTGMALYN